jgi:spore maturation protein CgeB
MRVAIVGRNGYDSLEGNLEDSFRHLGHEARIFDIYDLFSPLLARRFRKTVSQVFQASYAVAVRYWGQLADRVAGFWPDLVVVTYRDVVPEAIRRLKSNGRGMAVVHLNPDHISSLGRQYIFMSPYDAYFTKEPFLAETMRRKFGLNAFYLPESFNPRVHRKPDLPKAECEQAADVDLVVVANLHPYRVRFLEQLLARLHRPINIATYGNPARFPWIQTDLWKWHQRKEIVGEEKAAAFYGGRIAINTMHPSEFQGVNCRVFEALGSGAFLLTENKAVLKDLAEPGKEVVAFEDVDEAARLVCHYLDHPEERYAIAEAGYRRAMHEHTYEKRIEFILSKLAHASKFE